jgi:hypothetical protein
MIIKSVCRFVVMAKLDGGACGGDFVTYVVL